MENARKAGRRRASRVQEVRLARLTQILQRGKSVSRSEIEDELEVSRATLTRDIATLRDQLNMPIAHDRETGGYVLLDRDGRLGTRYELPGLWLSDNQIHAMLALINVTSAIDPGLFEDFLWPLRKAVKGLSGLTTENPPPPKDKLSIELPMPSRWAKDIMGELSRALYHDRQADLLLAKPDAVPIRYTPLRFAVTFRGWCLDAFREGDAFVTRFEVDTLKHAAGRNVRAKPLRLRNGCWFDGETALEVHTVVWDGPEWEDVSRWGVSRYDEEEEEFDDDAL